MQQLESKLPAFALPFVTRSLRRGLGRRYMMFSLLLASLALFVGLWAALGSGELEREFRQEVGLEEYRWDRQQADFAVYALDADDRFMYEQDLAYLQNGTPEEAYGEVYRLHSYGLRVLEQATWRTPLNAEQARLQARAKTLFDAHAAEHDYSLVRFQWSNPTDVERLERIVELRAIPELRAYSSPLGLREALLFASGIAGGLLLLLGTVIAPLLVAVQQAQERHENTLMPLTGTSLSPRQLVLGLASGPLAVTAIFAAPQVLIYMAGASIAGRPWIAAAMLVALAAASLLLVFGAQLLGHLVGKRRTPGVVGIALMGLAAVTWIFGIAMAMDGQNDSLGFTALLPHMGLSCLMGMSLEQTGFPMPNIVWVGTAANALGGLVVGWLALTALGRTIAGREGPRLTRLEAGLGALTCVILVHVAIPWDMGGSDAWAIRHFMGLAVLALPFAILLASRVPRGDGPARLRRVPVPALLAEFGVWVFVHVLVSSPSEGVDYISFHPVALLWMAWCVGVLGLITIRLVAVPNRLTGNLWTLVCALTLIGGFVQSMYWSLEHSLGVEDVFALVQLSPVLGLLQIAIVVWVPISLIRNLRKGLRATT